MTDLSHILNVLRQHKPRLSERYFVQEIGVFGSFARGEANEKSDVDVLVLLSHPIGLDFVLLGDELEDLLKLKVDLLSMKSLKPSLRKYIEKEVVYA